MDRINAVNEVNFEDNGSEEDVNNDIGVYSCGSNIQINNPSCINIKIYNCMLPALIDTGSDISIINKMHIPQGLTIINSKLTVKSACGNNIELNGRILGLRATLGTKEFKFSPRVTNTHPNYVILGVNCLQGNPHILLYCLLIYGWTNFNRKLCVGVLSIDKIMTEHQQSFSNKISKTICNLGKL